MTKNGSNIKVSLLGGLNEIGKNITMIELDSEILLIDCGVKFPDEDLLGVDVVIPDFSYLEKNKNKILGLLVTHGHEDHIGAIPYLLKKVNIPIFTLPMTMGLIEKKLKEHNLINIKKTIVTTNKKYKIGHMSFEFVRINHSIPDACSIAVYTKSGTIFHTGDFKFDFTPIDKRRADLIKLAEIGKKGVTLMLGESTNAERPGYTESESSVGNTLNNLFSGIDGRILVATFASNVHRLQQIIDAAYKNNRKVAVSGRSMVNIVEVASSLGYLKVPKSTLVELKDINNYKDSQVVIITTGSQGESLSALARISKMEHRNIQIKPGDVVIFSAHPIPGNEKTVSKVINDLITVGARVIYDTISEIHVSGHACQEELKLMLSLIQPKYFIPIHGEKKHIKAHADIAKSMGIREKNIFSNLENGDIVEFNRSFAKQIGKVASGNVFVDGLGVGDVGNVVLRDRKHLSEDGIIIAVVPISKFNKKSVSEPDIVTRGFVYVKESEKLLLEAKKTVSKVLDSYNDRRNKDLNYLKSLIRDELRQLLFQKTNRKPMILSIIVEV